MVGDLVAPADEHHDGVPLLIPVMRAGKRVAVSPPIAEIRLRAETELRHLPPPLAALGPMAYPVVISDGLRQLAAQCDRRILADQEKSQLEEYGRGLLRRKKAYRAKGDHLENQRSVAMRDDQLVAARDGRHGFLDGKLNIETPNFRLRRFSASEQGVTAERHDDTYQPDRSARGSRRKKSSMHAPAICGRLPRQVRSRLRCSRFGSEQSH